MCLIPRGSFLQTGKLSKSYQTVKIDCKQWVCTGFVVVLLRLWLPWKKMRSVNKDKCLDLSKHIEYCFSKHILETAVASIWSQIRDQNIPLPLIFLHWSAFQTCRGNHSNQCGAFLPESNACVYVHSQIHVFSFLTLKRASLVSYASNSADCLNRTAICVGTDTTQYQTPVNNQPGVKETTRAQTVISGARAFLKSKHYFLWNKISLCHQIAQLNHTVMAVAHGKIQT